MVLLILMQKISKLELELAIYEDVQIFPHYSQ